jgi:hypothetical protein
MGSSLIAYVSVQRMPNKMKTKILYRKHRPTVHMMNEFAYPSSLWNSLLEKIHLTNTFLTANILACKDTLNDRYGALMPRHGMNVLRRLYLFIVYVQSYHYVRLSIYLCLYSPLLGLGRFSVS